MKLNPPSVFFSVPDVLAILGFGLTFLQAFQAFSGNPSNRFIISIIVCFTLMVLSTFLWMYLKVRAHRKNYFSLKHAKRGSEGDVFIKYLNSAKRQIRAIHTIKTPPSVLYTNALLECLKRNVEVIRIIPEGILAERDIWNWHEQFVRHKYYRWNVIKGDEFRMPFSFVIIDDTHVFAYFPDSAQTDSRTEVLHFENKDVATLFRNVFQHLHIQACTIS